MNAYTFEDPIAVFTGAGYANLVRDHGGLAAYSYVFDGESGYLDHALATPSLAPKVTGVADWHINSDEPIALDYNTEFKTAGQVASFYDPGAYRSSDHDPVVVGIDVGKAPTTLTAAPAFTTLLGLVPVVFSATLKRAVDGVPLAGRTVTFRVLGDVACAATTTAPGTATCSAPIGILGFALARNYSATYAGSASDVPSSATGSLARRIVPRGLTGQAGYAARVGRVERVTSRAHVRDARAMPNPARRGAARSRHSATS